MKKATITLHDIKDPDAWWELQEKLGLVNRNTDETSPLVERHFKLGEYASIEIEVDDELHIVGGRIIPLRKPA